MDKLQPYVLWAFRLVVVVYSLIAGFIFLNRPKGNGDEDIFITDLQLIQTDGWWAAIVKGISIPYMLLSYLPAQVFESHIALRLVNILLLLTLAGYFYSFRNIKKIDFYLMLLFFVSTVGYFFSGINDTLLIVSAVIFFVETYVLAFKAEKGSLALWGTALTLMLFTRALAVVFIPVILLSVVLVLRKGAFKRKTWGIPVLVFLGMLVLNFPAIEAGGGLSYDKKDPPQDVTVTWAQRQYLAQLMVNEGTLHNHNHPSWQQTMDYVADHGENSLPKGIVSGMFFNVSLTIKEFFKDFVEIGIYGSRQIGLVLPFMLFFGLWHFTKERRINQSSYIPLVLFTMMCIFALIIISYVELRWLGAVFILAIYGFWKLQEEGKISMVFLNAHYAVLTLLSCYGMYGIIKAI